MRGTRYDIEKISAETGARTLIVTIASANARPINDLSQRCAAADVHMLVPPPVSQLVSGGVGLGDTARLDEVFAEYRPEVVFHAAALKHLPLLEKAPHEAIKSNIGGTQNVLAAAEKHGVDALINISTDKAANPTSVLGSRGSMLSVFNAQIARGGPVTVTHPEITRYFMTIPEAVLLVLQASVVGGGGEVLILDMGEPIRIADVPGTFDFLGSRGRCNT